MSNKFHYDGKAATEEVFSGLSEVLALTNLLSYVILPSETILFKFPHGPRRRVQNWAAQRTEIHNPNLIPTIETIDNLLNNTYDNISMQLN